jgi:hypothetical protein
MDNLVADKGKSFFVFVTKVIYHGIRSIQKTILFCKFLVEFGYMEEKSEKITIPERRMAISTPNLEILRSSFQNAHQLQDVAKKMFEAVQPTLAMLKTIDLQLPSRITDTDMVIPYVRPVEYDIRDELRELNKNHRKVLALQNDSVDCLIYDSAEACLTHVLGGRNFSYDLTEDGKRRQMFDVLYRAKKYVQTDELKVILKCPTTQAVAKIAQTFNAYAENTLRLKNVRIIQGKKGSGYRINPKISIESVTNY